MRRLSFGCICFLILIATRGYSAEPLLQINSFQKMKADHSPAVKVLETLNSGKPFPADFLTLTINGKVINSPQKAREEAEKLNKLDPPFPRKGFSFVEGVWFTTGANNS